MAWGMRAIAVIGAFLSALVPLTAGDWSQPAAVLVGVGFLLWICTPYLVIYLGAYRVAGSRIGSILALTGSALVTALALAAYAGAFLPVGRHDSQAGMLMVTVPFWQLVGLFVTFLVTRTVMIRRGQPSPMNIPDTGRSDPLH